MKRVRTAALLLSVLLLTSCDALELRDAADVPAVSPMPAETETEPAGTDDLDAMIREAFGSDNPTAGSAETDTPADPMEKAELTDPFAGTEITVTACGDNLIHPNIYIDASYRKTSEKDFDFLPMYSHIAPHIASADIAFINQETVMAGEGYANSGWPTFNSPQQLGLDLTELGFDVIGMANNHMLDKGAAGLESTINFWNSQPVTQIGGYLNEEDYARLRITETEGVKIVWLTYTLHTNMISKPASSPLVIPYIDDELILSDLARAKEAGDFVIVSIHWGDENTQTPNDEQKRLASLIAENGADVIFGHHSHTLQPIEWIETDRGRTLCIYSLGNLVSGMARPVNQVGGFLNFTIRSDGFGNLVTEDVKFLPTVFYYGMDWYNTHVYWLDDYTADIAQTHGVAISGYTLSHEAAETFVTNVIPEEFLPGYLKD